MIEVLKKFIMDTGIAALDIPHFIMLCISCLLLYLAIVKQYEPLLLIPIAFGMLLSNLPVAGMFTDQITRQPIELIQEAGKQIMVITEPSSIQPGGLLKYFYQGNRLGIFPPIIFMGIGAMTDFGPLIANPKSL
ncbi:MAG: glutaconyl-CoA decarboxylase subunit beta, partial [Clostridiales bacterium]|nr:glutaconyl-CoA decarboxylase subunit beta [Clostridiales bacterium]